MLKDAEAGSGGCSGITSRPRRLIPRFSLRRLLYTSPLIGRRISRPSSSSGSRNAKGEFETSTLFIFTIFNDLKLFCKPLILFISAKDVPNKLPDIEKGEAKVNGPSHSQYHNVDLQRASSRGSVLSTAGKVNYETSDKFMQVEIPKISSNIKNFFPQSTENGTTECPLCLAELPIELFPVIQSCHHRSCYDCFQQYLKVEISESRVNIACPECSEPLHPNGK